MAILFYLLIENKVKGGIIFSIKEEIGKSGELIVNYLKSQKIEKTNNLLVIDTTPFSKKIL